MSTYQILYNPRSNNGHGEAEVKSLSNKLESNELIFNDITKIGDIKAFINSLGADEKIINLLSTVLAGYIAGIAKAYKIKPGTLRDDIFKDITRLIDDFLKKGGLY